MTLDKFSPNKRREIISRIDGETLLDFFYQYSIKIEQGDKYNSDTMVEIMDTWGEIRSEIKRRMCKQ